MQKIREEMPFANMMSAQMMRRLFAILVLVVVGGLLTLNTNAQVNGFNASGLQGESLNNPTSLQFGPDGRLYVSQRFNNPTNLFAYNIDRVDANDYQVESTEPIQINGESFSDFIPNHNDDGTPNSNTNRQVTAIFVTGTGANPVVYVSSSDWRQGGSGGATDTNLDTNSGVISRLTCVGGMDENNLCTEWDKVDLVRGLPRSEENHSPNGMELDEATNTLYISIGGFTNAGAPSNNFAFISEYALSGAILAIDLDALDALPVQTDTNLYSSDGFVYKWVYDLPTLDDPTRDNVNGINDPSAPGYDGIDPNDPFGGNDGLNQAKVDQSSPVKIYSAGYRNLYDIIIAENGIMYGVDNGANSNWGGHPVKEADFPVDTNGVNNSIDAQYTTTTPGACTNQYIASELGSTGTGAGNDSQVNNKNGLHAIRPLQPGDFNYVAGFTSPWIHPYYGGHPTPLRGNPGDPSLEDYGAGLYTRGNHTVNPGADGFSDGYWRHEILDVTDPNFKTQSLPVDWPPVPSELASPIECDFRNSGQDDNTIANYGPSTNGLTEYTASNLGGALQGDLLLAAYSGAGEIYYVDLDASGTVVLNCPTPPFNGTSTLNNCNNNNPAGFFASNIGSNPLDIIAQGDNDIFGGTVWAATYGADNITVFEPTDYDGIDDFNCVGTDDPTLDEDEDGYTNADEIDNGTNPCSGASKPGDFDGTEINGFLVSNLNDPDDDDDGLNDTIDPFAWDSTNGAAFDLPQNLELVDEDGFGFGNIRFTGLMTDSRDYLNRADLTSNTELILGGTSGIYTDPFVTDGTALSAANDMDNGFQFGVNVDDQTGPFVVRAWMKGSFFNNQIPQPDQSQGVQIGTGSQSDYLKFVINHQGFQVIYEVNDSVTTVDYPITDWGNIISSTLNPIDKINLYLEIDPATGTVTPYYEIQEQGLVMLSSINLPVSPLLDAIQGDYQVNGVDSKLAVGTIATSNNAPTFGASWELIYVNPAGAPVVVNPLSDVDAFLASDPLNIDLSDVFTDDFGASNLAFSASSTDDGVVSTGISGTELTLTFNGEGTADVTVTADDGNDTASDTFTVSVTDEPLTLYRVNAGGDLVAATDSGPDWAANSGTGEQAGTGFSVNTGNTSAHNVSGRDASVPDYVPQQIYSSERWDPAAGNEMAWTFDVAPGEYIVRLYLSNGFSGTSEEGERVFDISIEGIVVEDSFGPVAEFGHQFAGMKEYPVTVADAALNIDFQREVENPNINGIEILQISTTGEAPIILSDIGNQTSVEGDDVAALGLFVTATGGDGNLSYAISNAPAGVQIEPTNGQFFGTIAAGAAANSPYTVTVTVDDSDANTSDAQTTTFTWTVSEPAAPALVFDPTSLDFTVEEGNTTTGSFTLSTNTDDPLPGDVSLTADKSWIANLTTSGFTVDASALSAGSDIATITATGTGFDDATLAVSLTVTEPIVINPGDVLFRVNAGGPELAAADGSQPVWSADTGQFGNAGNSAYLVSNSPNTSTYNGDAGSAHEGDIDASNLAIPASVPTDLFNTERYDPAPAAPNMKWEFSVPSGTEIEVRLYFAELFGQIDQTGERVFDISIEGNVPAVYDDIDQFAIAGAKGAFVIPYTLTMADNTLDIEFIHSVENPAIKGIEIVAVEDDTPTATINGSVELQGRPAAPDPAWVMDLTITLYEQGTSNVVGSPYNVTTDDSGNFTLNEMPIGTYEIAVKGFNTLQVMETVTMVEGDNAIDFGILAAGDANGDNVVELSDFGLLAASYNLSAGDTDFNASADFNGDGTVELSDFGLLAANYNSAGEAPGN